MKIKEKYKKNYHQSVIKTVHVLVPRKDSKREHAATKRFTITAASVSYSLFGFIQQTNSLTLLSQMGHKWNKYNLEKNTSVAFLQYVDFRNTIHYRVLS